MRTVNNKYVIESEINIEEYLSDYIVRSLEDNKRYVLCILKNDFTYEKTREYLLNKFKTIKNLNFEKIVNVISMEIIYNIDGIKLDKPQYGYLIENIQNGLDAQGYLKKCSSREKLDIFMEVCSIVNTLNKKGYVFEDISLKDIKLIPISNDKVKIKINNLLQNELKKLNLVHFIPYKYNIQKSDEKSANKDNVAQLLKLFNLIFSKQELETTLKQLRYIKALSNEINKPVNINYFVNEINNKMKTDYKLFEEDALNEIQTDLDLIGMDEEVKIVEKKFEKILESKENYKVIAFHGEEGSGKSRFLEEIKKRIESKYFKDIIYIGSIDNENISKKKLYKYSLGNFLNNIDKNLKERYEVYVKKFISILLEKENSYEENQQNLQLINRLGKLISEYSMSKPFIMLIDDLDKKNFILKSFVRYISLMANGLQNVMILFTISESINDKNFLNYINELKALANYEEYKISCFNQYDTTKMIRRMLNTNQELNKLEVKIYSQTLGNPQYIKGVIKELYESGYLYFDRFIGEWKVDAEAIDIMIPKYLEKKIEESISSLSRKETNVLKKMSIFETPLDEKIIIENILKKSDEIEVYKYLKIKGFFIDKISDQGILVGFFNNLLRNIMYLKLDQEQKIEMHYQASIFFEEILFETDYYIEEFLMHLERSHNYEKAFFYTMKYANVQGSFGNISKAISYYKKLLKYPNYSSNSEIAIDIAKLYEKNSNHLKGYEFFEKANQFAVKNDEIENIIYTLLEMIIIKITDVSNINNDIDYTLKCIRRLLDIKLYPKGEAYYYHVLALKYRLSCDDKLVISNAEKALFICEENRIKDDIYAWIMIVLTSTLIRHGNYERAKELCLKSNKIFIDNNSINGELLSKLLYADICHGEGDSNEITLERYLEVAKLSNKFKSYKKEVLSLIYIADIYSQEKKYAQVEEYLLKALKREKEEEVYYYSFRICNRLCLLYIGWGKNSSAVKYYRLSKQMQKNVKLPPEDIINGNYTYALYNMMICNYEMAYDYLKRIYALVFNLKNFRYKAMLCEYYEIMLHKCKNEKSIKFLYTKLDESIKKLKNLDMEVEIKIRAIKRILLLGYTKLAAELFSEINVYPKDYDVQGMYVFIELSFKQKSYYNFLINKALRVCSFVNNQEVKADLYWIIGQTYSRIKCHSLAMNYYYESITIHANAINCLPKNDKLSYINNSNFLEIRKSLIMCFNDDLNIDAKFKEFNEIKRNKEINEVLNELNITDILNNIHAFKLIGNLYEKCYFNKFNDILNVFEKFSSDTIVNMKNILKHMARLTLADQAMIVMENNKGKNDVICTYRISEKNEINRYLSLKVDSEDDVFILTNSDAKLYQLNKEVLKNKTKALLYMKILSSEKFVNNTLGSRAGLILIANNSLNNVNHESMKIIEKFKPFLTFLLEKYNLTISSTLDKLTGAYNRKYFEEALLFILDNAIVRKRQFSIIMFDIDDFKGINDKYGHQTGDEVLVKLVSEVKKSVERKDIIGRYGGEEFIILLPDTNQEKAINIAEKIRINVKNAKILGDKRNVTISIGIAISTTEAIGYEEMVSRADQALYEAKREGKNKCILWEKNFGRSVNSNNELTGILSGNATRDYNLALIFRKIANIIKVKSSKEDKIYEFISKVIQVIDCETITVFIVNNKKIVNRYSEFRNQENIDIVEKYNFNLIDKVMENGEGLYLVDWNSMDNHNCYGIPDWKSICIAPIICNSEILAMIYLSISVNKKEYVYNDYNLLNCLAEISLPIFLCDS